ncbi:hypothetical protein SAMN05880582_11115 [Rhizobium sp. RU20A]|nr:hypothetical protein SAMN05880582_11115 [Rhizobium sp. RU20A]
MVHAEVHSRLLSVVAMGGGPPSLDMAGMSFARDMLQITAGCNVFHNSGYPASRCTRKVRMSCFCKVGMRLSDRLVERHGRL